MRVRRKKRLRLLLLMPLLLILLFFSGILKKDESIGIPMTFRMEREANESRDWNLILINENNYVPQNYEVKLITLSNGRKVDSRIYPDLQAMFDAARTSGLQLFVREGYRTREEQQKLLDDKIESFRDEGYSKAKAKDMALEWVAAPGTSEHELGIAVDINADTSVSSGDAVYSWLENNAHEYGFIRRYPADKVNITGINNEPWHYRYVGYEAARTIYANGWCLEEYIENWSDEKNK